VVEKTKQPNEITSMKFNRNLIMAATLASFTIGANAATLLFSDNFDTAGDLAPNPTPDFNDSASLAADQSGTAATKTYTTALDNAGSNYAYQRGNGGKWLMFANGTQGGAFNMQGSLNYDIAAAANTLSSALEIKFNMEVLGGTAPEEWTSFTVGNVNPFVNANTVGFGALFRDNGATQQFSNTTLDLGAAAMIGSTGLASFADGGLFTFLISDSTGNGSAFTNNGATDIVKMYFGATLINTFSGLNLGTDDQFISFHARNTETYIDNLSITAIPEPSAALLGGLGLLALLRRRR
jgi:hypothetical protein